MNKRLRNLSRLAPLVAILLLLGNATLLAESRQEHVHQMSHLVMPFDISKTVHIFKMTVSGGVQQVIAKDPGASEQIALIQRHLQHEAERFRYGDYAAPATLHGADMPGLKELQAGAARIKVTYAALPAGAEITLETADLHRLTAVHRWFGAQLSEHGADARAE
jgi:hypothetical protein